MWGNWLGWAISAAISLAAIFVGYQIYALGQPTLATGWVGQTLRPPSLDAAARAVVPEMTDSAVDAGKLYRDAIADYAAHKAAYAKVGNGDRWDKAAADRLVGFDDLVRAGQAPTADVYASDPAEIVNYEQRVRSLDQLSELGQATALAAANARAGGDLATAKAYADAVFALGLHLYDERLTIDELTTGLELMGQGSGLLKQVAGAEHDDAALSIFTAFDDARTAEYQNLVDPARRVLADPQTANVARHSGDFAAAAADPSLDRVWRVAAVRALGRLKFNNANHADGVRAGRIVDAMASDASLDPAVRTAAKAAAHITEGEFHATR